MWNLYMHSGEFVQKLITLCPLQSCDQWDPGQFLGVVYIHRLRKEHMIKKVH